MNWKIIEITEKKIVIEYKGKVLELSKKDFYKEAEKLGLEFCEWKSNKEKVKKKEKKEKKKSGFLPGAYCPWHFFCSN